MSKKLAIKGHSTRGKEVIELLEMMGGSNIHNLSGNDIHSYHMIKGIKNEIRDELRIFSNENIYYFTLEEFLEKYPYKVGDKVVYTKFGDNCDDYPVTIESMNWTGTTIEYTFNDCVTCLAKDLKMWNGEPDAVISGIYLNSCDYADEVELYLGDYEIEVRDGKTYAIKKKPKYPKTIEECVKLLRVDFKLDMDSYKRKLMANFYRLILCRDTYWKIAGEEMGLGKPWQPNWDDEDEYKYGLFRLRNLIYKDTAAINPTLLIFPTQEMRDVFYENFKDLIEQCKELL
jgi:hypothetical protein